MKEAVATASHSNGKLGGTLAILCQYSISALRIVDFLVVMHGAGVRKNERQDINE